jgi:mycothiol system anti-sigma-R factor
MSEQPKCGPICEEVLKELEQLIDGELDADVRAEVELHLSDCAPCMSHADFRAHVKALVATKCAEERLPDGLQERLTQLLHDAG